MVATVRAFKRRPQSHDASAQAHVFSHLNAFFLHANAVDAKDILDAAVRRHANNGLNADAIWSALAHGCEIWDRDRVLANRAASEEDRLADYRKAKRALRGAHVRATRAQQRDAENEV